MPKLKRHPRLNIWLSPELNTRLELHIEKHGTTKQETIVAALDTYLGPGPIERDEIRTMLHTILSEQREQQVDLRYLLEAFGAFVWQHLSETEPPTSTERAILKTRAKERYPGFVRFVVSRVRRGGLRESLDELILGPLADPDPTPASSPPASSAPVPPPLPPGV